MEPLMVFPQKGMKQHVLYLKETPEYHDIWLSALPFQSFHYSII